MNPNFTQGLRASREADFWLVAALLLLVWMPSGQSLWIDEAEEARYAMVESFAAWLAELRSDDKSQSQMPLAMLVRFLAAAFLGHGEFALRAINYLWGGLTLICFWRAGRMLRLPWLPMLVAAHPFYWFYMDEARPYAMTIFAASLTTLGWLGVFPTGAESLPSSQEASRQKRQGWIAFICGALLLIYTNILGVFTTAALFAVIFYHAVKVPGFLPRRWGLALMLWLLLALPVGLWYAHTILQDFGGKKAAVASLGLPNIIFSAYEFSGFAGLGLERNALRAAVAEHGLQSGLTALLPYAAPLAALVFIWLAIAFCAWRVWGNLISEVWWKALLAAAVLSLAFIAGASYVKGSPFWGRHLASIFPLFIMLLGYSLGVIRAKAHFAGTMLLTSLLLCWLASSLQLRFVDRFSKDDYRGAASFAKAALARGETVIWGGNASAAVYYGVDGERLRILFNPKPDEVAELPGHSAIVILSKPDAYDCYGSLREYLKQHNADEIGTLQAFGIYSLGRAE